MIGRSQILWRFAMGLREIQRRAGELSACARALLMAFPRTFAMNAVVAPDPTRGFESFRSPHGWLESSWLDLVIFHATIRRAKQGDSDAFAELPRQLLAIEREYGSRS